MSGRNKNLISLLLTGIIISMLIMSGPAGAVTVGISNISDVSQGSTVSFLLNVDLDSNERIPINNISIEIKNASSGSLIGTYVFDSSGYVIDGKSSVSVSLINSSASYGNDTLYGYGYGSGSNFSNLVGYGYGYGYASTVSGELYFNVTVNDSSIINSPGGYTIEALIFTGEPSKYFFSTISASSFNVTSTNISAPVITINRPVENQVFSNVYNVTGYSNMTINYTVTDDVSVSSVKYYLSAYIENESTSASYQNTSIVLHDGSYSLTVYATDSEGAMSQATRNFIVNSSYNNWLNTTKNSSVSNESIVSTDSNLTDSTISGISLVIGGSNVSYSSTVANSTVNRSIVQNSSITNATSVDSTILSGSKVNSSSTLSNSTINNSAVSGSNLTRVVILNVAVVNSSLANANITNARITNNLISGGTNATVLMNYSNIVINFANIYRSTNITTLIRAVNITNVSSVTVNLTREIASNSSQNYTIKINVNQNLTNVTIKAAMTDISPTGDPLENLVSDGFLYIEAPEINSSLNNATITMTVNGTNGTYTRAWCVVNTTGGWEYTNRTSADTFYDGTNVTCNVTHFSVFALQGYTATSTTPSDSASAGGGGGGVSITSDNRFEVSTGILGPGDQTELEIIGHRIFKKLRIKAKNFIGGSVIRGYTVSKPNDVSEPSGIVYNFLDIRTNIEDKEIDFVEWEFGIEKSWIDENNIDPDKIMLFRYSENKWNRLKTDRNSEDTEKIYYRATSPGFSYFVITGEAKSISFPPIFPPVTEQPGQVPTPEEPSPEIPPIEVVPPEEVPGGDQPEEKEPTGTNIYVIVIGVLVGIILLAAILLYIFRENPGIRELLDWFR